jgi:hypothetical protein
MAARGNCAYQATAVIFNTCFMQELTTAVSYTNQVCFSGSHYYVLGPVPFEADTVVPTVQAECLTQQIISQNSTICTTVGGNVSHSYIMKYNI